MTTNREQLVADWREQLATAQASATGPIQEAWLARMRVRLYSFLLTCYGEGQWRADDARPANAPAALETELRDEPTQAKPARSAGEIRTVLKTLANAQDDPHAPGPLAVGLDWDSWIVVATSGSGLSIERCQYMLHAAGIQSQIDFRGRSKVLEVPAAFRQQAFALLERNKRALSVPKRQTKLDAHEASLLFGLIMAFGVLWITALFSYPFFATPELRPDDESYRMLNSGRFDAGWQRVFGAIVSATLCICGWLFCGWVYCRFRRGRGKSARSTNATSNPQA